MRGKNEAHGTNGEAQALDEPVEIRETGANEVLAIKVGIGVPELGEVVVAIAGLDAIL